MTRNSRTESSPRFIDLFPRERTAASSRVSTSTRAAAACSQLAEPEVPSIPHRAPTPSHSPKSPGTAHTTLGQVVQCAIGSRSSSTAEDEPHSPLAPLTNSPRTSRIRHNNGAVSPIQPLRWPGIVPSEATTSSITAAMQDLTRPQIDSLVPPSFPFSTPPNTIHPNPPYMPFRHDSLSARTHTP